MAQSAIDGAVENVGSDDVLHTLGGRQRRIAGALAGVAAGAGRSQEPPAFPSVHLKVVTGQAGVGVLGATM
jgi:hypothetical protein